MVIKKTHLFIRNNPSPRYLDTRGAALFPKVKSEREEIIRLEPGDTNQSYFL